MAKVVRIVYGEVGKALGELFTGRWRGRNFSENTDRPALDKQARPL